LGSGVLYQDGGNQTKKDISKPEGKGKEASQRWKRGKNGRQTKSKGETNSPKNNGTKGGISRAFSDEIQRKGKKLKMEKEPTLMP